MILILLIVRANNPLSISIIMVLISLLVASMAGIYNSSWLFLVIALIFLGGIIVIFLYLSTLSLSDKLTSPKIRNLVIILVVITPIISLRWKFSNFNISKSFMEPLAISNIIFLITYLLLALILAVKLSQSFKGAIIKKW